MIAPLSGTSSLRRREVYGTVARMRIKPGALDKLQEMANAEEMKATPGYVSTTVYQMDADPNEIYMAVVFESKEAYFKNAESPEQNTRYEEMVALLDGSPEWHDGEIIFCA
jgi:quinol monooxygenase YgiN